jgi:hypothetical protein
MFDVETLIRDELELLAPRGETVPDWHDVRRRSRPPRRRVAAVAVAAALVVAVVAAPTFALSSGVRGFFGLGHRPLLVRVVSVLTVPAGEGYVARLWSSPLGACQFVTLTRRTLRLPRRAAICRASGNRLRLLKRPVTYTLSPRRSGRQAVGGRVAPRLHAMRVVLRSSGGSQRLAFRRGWFLGIVTARPPYTIVAYDARDRVVVRKRIR